MGVCVKLCNHFLWLVTKTEFTENIFSCSLSPSKQVHLGLNSVIPKMLPLIRNLHVIRYWKPWVSRLDVFNYFKLISFEDEESHQGWRVGLEALGWLFWSKNPLTVNDVWLGTSSWCIYFSIIQVFGIIRWPCHISNSDGGHYPEPHCFQFLRLRSLKALCYLKIWAEDETAFP